LHTSGEALPQVDVVVLTIIPVELAATRTALGLRTKADYKSQGGTHYWTGTVPNTQLKVALSVMAEAGPTRCSAATIDAIHEFRPKLVVLVGIAAGAKGKLRLGDVVLSERVVSYDLGSVEAGGKIVQRQEGNRPEHAIQQNMMAYLSDSPAPRITRIFREAGGEFPVVPPGGDLDPKHVALSALKVASATIASGSKLVRDGELFDEWRRGLHGKVEVAEMEAAGLVDACGREGVPWLVIRGISDFGDNAKHDGFHEFAARAAAAVLVDFLAQGYVAIASRTPAWPPVTHPSHAWNADAALERYRRICLDSYEIIDLAGITNDMGAVMAARTDPGRRSLFIPPSVHVEGDAAVTEDAEASTTRDAARGRRRRSRLGPYPKGGPAVALGLRLRPSSRMVILGEPGSGKSTMIRWLTTTYLRRADGQADEHIAGAATLPRHPWLPIVVRCRSLGEAHLKGALDEWLSWTIHKLEMDAEDEKGLPGVLKERLRAGTAMLLVDGLDEISDAEARDAFCDQLDHVASSYREAPIIVTSRLASDRPLRLPHRRSFERARLAELTALEKDQFIRAWCEIIEPAAERRERAAELIRAIHDDDRVERLACNPLLLLTIAMVKRKTGRVAVRKKDLYEEAIQELLRWRAKTASLPPDEALPQLRYVAYEMCRRNVQQLRQDEILALFEGFRRQYPEVRRAAERSPETFLAALEAHTNILVRAGMAEHDGIPTPLYAFRHLTFQEYLAGRALVHGHFPGHKRKMRVAECLAHFAVAASEVASGTVADGQGGESWKGALRLAVSCCNEPDVDDALGAVLAGGGASRPGWGTRARAVLAARCLADEPNVSLAVAEQVLEQLVSVAGSEGWWEVEDACLELSMSTWSEELGEQLVAAYVASKEGRRSPYGALRGSVGIAPVLRKHATLPPGWIADRVTRMRGKNEARAIGAALEIMEAAFRRRLDRAPEVASALMDMTRASPACVHAATWALAWMAGGIGAAAPAAVWVPTEHDVRRLLDLVPALGARREAVRYVAAIFGCAREHRAVAPLVEILRATSSTVAEGIVAELGRIGDRSVAPVIAARLTDKDEGVRRAAVGALAQLTCSGQDARLLRKGEGLHGPWLDRRRPIGPKRVEIAAKRASLSPAEARRRYEELAPRFLLTLQWTPRRGGAA
jgi:nucleoside phosphorylase